MKKWLFCIFCILTSLAGPAQTITGRVTGENKQPVLGASVFFSNTSFGTVTDNQGNFTLERIPPGRYELIVSYVGYQTSVQTIETKQVSGPLEVALKLKPQELDNVVIEPYEKDNWERWGRFFMDNFIGKSIYATNCDLKNARAIQFRNYRSSKRLLAFSDEPLIIENKALGYRIKYQLERFEYNFKTGVLFYQGFPSFEEIETKRNARREKWEKRREEVYYGSMMHFMRCVFRNTITENGFLIKHLRIEPNYEKQRVAAIMKQNVHIRTEGKTNIISIGGYDAAKNTAPDSSAYYRGIMRQPDEVEKVISGPLTGDSIAFAINSTTAGLQFPEYLQIIYLKAKEPIEYARSHGRELQQNFQVSKMQLVNHDSIAVLANGSYYESQDVMLYSFWAFWEKMATMLPFDYQPPANSGR